MPQRILHDGGTQTQDPHVTPPTHTPSSSSQAQRKQRRGFTRYPHWVDAAIAAHAPRPWVRLVATRLFLELLDIADNQTHVTRLLKQQQIAEDLGVSIDSVQTATKVLRACGVCTTFAVYVQRRRVGMRYRMRLEASKTAAMGPQLLQDLRYEEQQEQPRAERAACPPPDPANVSPIAETLWPLDVPTTRIEPAKKKQVRHAAFGIDPLRLTGTTEAPDAGREDQVQAVRELLAERHMTATDAQIHDALDFVRAYQQRKRRELPLIGPVARRVLDWIRRDPSVSAFLAKQDPEEAIVWLRKTNNGLDRDEAATVLQQLQAVSGAPPQTAPNSSQTAPRATIGEAGRLSAEDRERRRVAAEEARERLRVAEQEKRDRRRVAEEETRAEAEAAIAALPPDAASALREEAGVRDKLAELRKYPGLTDQDRQAREHDAIVHRVVGALRGRSITATIAALVEAGRCSPPPLVHEPAPDVAARFAELRRQLPASRLWSRRHAAAVR